MSKSSNKRWITAGVGCLALPFVCAALMALNNSNEVMVTCLFLTICWGVFSVAYVLSPNSKQEDRNLQATAQVRGAADPDQLKVQRLQDLDDQFSRFALYEFVTILYQQLNLGFYEPQEKGRLLYYMEAQLLENLSANLPPNIEKIEHLALAKTTIKQMAKSEERGLARVSLSFNSQFLAHFQNGQKRWLGADNYLVLTRNLEASSSLLPPNLPLACPKCGATSGVDPLNSCCRSCHQDLSSGRYAWMMSKLEVNTLPYEQVELWKPIPYPRYGTLWKVGARMDDFYTYYHAFMESRPNSSREECITNWKLGARTPNLRTPDLHMNYEAFMERHPDFSWEEFTNRLRQTFAAYLKAVNTDSLEPLLDVATPYLQSNFTFELDNSLRLQVHRRLQGATLRKAEVISIAQDPCYEIITVYFVATSIDYVCQAAPLNGLVDGDMRQPIFFSEFWTFIRPLHPSAPPATAATPTPELIFCPHCGASLRGLQVVECPYCQAPLVEAAPPPPAHADWLLAKIELNGVVGYSTFTTFY